MDNLNTEYYEYEGVLFRRIKLNDTWKWFKRIEVFNYRMKIYIKEWQSFVPTEKLEKTYLRQKKLERLLGEQYKKTSQI